MTKQRTTPSTTTNEEQIMKLKLIDEAHDKMMEFYRVITNNVRILKNKIKSF